MDFFLNHDLIKLLNLYARNNMYADEAFARKVIKIIVLHKHLKSNVTDTKFASLGSKTIAAYDYLTSKVIINLAAVKTTFEDMVFTNPSDLIMAHNVSVVAVITHELNHARQFIKANKNGNLEEQLYYISLEDNIISKMLQQGLIKESDLDINYIQALEMMRNKEKTSRDIYLSTPNERMSEIDTYSRINAIVDRLDFQDKYLAKDFYKSVLASRMLAGYTFDQNKHTVTSPTFRYLAVRNALLNTNAKVGELDEQLRGYAKGKDLDEIIYLGLPIHPYNYLDILGEKESTISYQLVRERTR